MPPKTENQEPKTAPKEPVLPPGAVYLGSITDTAAVEKMIETAAAHGKLDARIVIKDMVVLGECDNCGDDERARRFVGGPDGILLVSDDSPCVCPCHPLHTLQMEPCCHAVNVDGWCLLCGDAMLQTEDECIGAFHLAAWTCLDELRGLGSTELAAMIERLMRAAGLPDREDLLPFDFTDVEEDYPA